MDVGAYPSIEELLRTDAGSGVDVWVRDQLIKRQQEHGGAYITDELHTDGRRLNRSIGANNANDAMEELVDAVYALLVLSLKGYRVRHIVRELCQIWQDLSCIRGTMEESY